jgi:hypothetical protein
MEASAVESKTTTVETKTVRKVQYFREKQRLIVVISDLTRNLADIKAGYGTCELKYGAAIYKHCADHYKECAVLVDAWRHVCCAEMPPALLEDMMKRMIYNNVKLGEMVIDKDMKTKLRRTAAGRLEKAPVVFQSMWCFPENVDALKKDFGGEIDYFALGSKKTGQKLRGLVARHGVRGERVPWPK